MERRQLRKTRPLRKRVRPGEGARADYKSHIKQLFESHPQPMWVYDLQTLRFLLVNAAAVAHYGYSEEEFLAMTIVDIRPPSEYQRLRANLAATSSTGLSKSGVWTHVKKDGSRIEVEISSHGFNLGRRRCRFVLVHDLTARRSVEAALYRSEQLQRRLIDQLPLQIFWKDLELRYSGCNKVFADAAGLADPAEVVGQRDAAFPWAHNAERICADDRAIIASGLPLLNREDHLVDAEGKERWFLINKLPLHGQDGAIAGVLGTIDDITTAKRAERTQRLQGRAIEASVNAIIITVRRAAGNLIEYANPAFLRMTGYRMDEVLGRDCRFLQGEDTEQEGLVALRAALRRQAEATVLLRNYRKDGTLFWNQLHVAPVADAAGQVTHYVGVLTDVTSAMLYQDELEHQANHDALTRLPNRNLFKDRLEQAIAYSTRYGDTLWVLLVDLDNFKLVNDALGHDSGDRLLQTIAARLRACAREADTVARLGGDEFTLLFMGQPGADLSPRLAHAVLDAVAAPVLLDGHTLAPTCSIGISVYPKDGASAPLLLKHADIAMYRAKEAGRNQLQFYTAEMNERITERTLIESHLRKALQREEFLLHYQPRVDLQTGGIVGMEALIRWQHPELGLVAPARFIGIAEETGLIVDIGNWVLRTACFQNQAWQASGLANLRVAVNVSARQFRENGFVEQVMAALRDSGLDPGYLELELTESLMIQNIDESVAMLGVLKQLGVALSIDDFGTGYSSLSYLKRFPVDYLKIDQSFVRDMLSDPNGAAIVRSVIALGHCLNFRVIAEGVENAAQLAYLERNGCDEIQGYHFSRPLTRDAMRSLLVEGRRLERASRDPGPRPVLLLLDDEPNILSALTRMLRQDDYRILSCTTPEEAFGLLALNEVHVVISDQRMPMMSGTEFLNRVKQLYPDTVRIILSGYTDLGSVIDAINRGAIYRFFTKPWEEENLRANIRDAFAHYRMLRSARALPA